ncbi:high mobility group box domain-containing protein, partial [Amylostereum chailletii]
IPRPPNAFIIFRSELCAWLDKFEPEYRELSCVCGALWRSMTQEERRPYVERAVADAKTHMELYPDYVFSPK